MTKKTSIICAGEIYDSFSFNQNGGILYEGVVLKGDHWKWRQEYSGRSNS